MKTVLVLLFVIALGIFVFFSSRKRADRPPAEMPTPSPAVLELVAKGDKIAAIARYRQETRASLLEAHRVIEHYSPD